MTPPTPKPSHGSTGFVVWADRWSVFLNQNEKWWDRHVAANQGLLYTIPSYAIDALSKSIPSSGNSRAQVRLLSELDEAAERQFLATCQSYLSDTVGVWFGQPLQFDLLFSVESNLDVDESQLQFLCSTGPTREQVVRSLKEGARKSSEARHQMLGYVGFLTFHEPFRKERDSLQNLWRSLPSPVPLPQGSANLESPPIPAGTDSIRMQASEEGQRFLEQLAAFIRKWNLSRLVTWDLLMPQGPLTVPAGLVTHLRGWDATVDYVPDYYDVPSNVDLRAELRERQRKAGVAASIPTELPITDTSGRAGAASAWETAFRMWLVETTIHRRYGKLRGTVARLVPEFANEFGISGDRVTKIRQCYSHLFT